MFYPSDPAKLFPLQVNKATGEPYLQLPSPHEKIIITPARPSDAVPMTKNMNDPRVYEYLAGPPFPYKLEEHGIRWVGRAMDESGRLFWEMEDGGGKWVDGCPVHSIREMQEDGTDVYIGDITIRREDPANAWARAEKDNLSKAVGDPTILWSIGDWLDPEYHRRGIMSHALRTLITAWCVPRMNCHRIHATAFVGNAASVGVFTKTGFKHAGDIEDVVRLPEGRGSSLRSLHTMEWIHEEGTEQN